jgi:hypothetical protein
LHASELTCLGITLALSLLEVMTQSLHHILQPHNAGVQGWHKFALDDSIGLISSNPATSAAAAGVPDYSHTAFCQAVAPKWSVWRRRRNQATASSTH